MARTIGALWLREKKDDNKKKYLAGEIDLGFGTLRIGVFRNEDKEKNEQPDYRIVAFEFEPLKSQQKEEGQQ